MAAWIYGILFLVIFAGNWPGRDAVPAWRLVAVRGRRARSGRYARHAHRAVCFAAACDAAILGNTSTTVLGVHRTRGVQRTIILAETGLSAAHEEFFRALWRHGVFLSRFMPIIRTFAPLSQASAGCRPPAFWPYNLAGAICWVALFIWALFVGNIRSSRTLRARDDRHHRLIPALPIPACSCGDASLPEVQRNADQGAH